MQIVVLLESGLVIVSDLGNCPTVSVKGARRCMSEAAAVAARNRAAILKNR